MKKLLAIFLTLILMLSFVSCGTDKSDDAADDTTKAEDTTVADTTADVDAGATADVDAGATADADTTANGGYDRVPQNGADEDAGDSEQYTCSECSKKITLDEACMLAGADGITYMCSDCYDDFMND